MVTAWRDRSHRVRRIEEHDGFVGRLPRDLSQHADVRHHVERSPMRADDEVVVLDLDAVHRRDRQPVLERLPDAAIVERDVEAGFGPEKQQPFAFRVFTNGAWKIVGRQAADDLRPGLAVVRRLVDVGRAVGALIAIAGEVCAGGVVG